MKNVNLKELNAQEMKQIDGGNPILGIAALALAVLEFGYQIGKDRAEADRR